MTKDPVISLKGHSLNWWKSFASVTRARASVTANVALGNGVGALLKQIMTLQ